MHVGQVAGLVVHPAPSPPLSPPADRSKPGAAAAREERECWIRDKYLRHVFLSTLEADGSEQAHDLSPHQRLYDAAQSNTIIEVRQAGRLIDYY